MTEPKKLKKQTHPWRIFAPGMLKSNTRYTPFSEPFKSGSTKKNRAQ